MTNPDNIPDALRHMHYLLGAAARDLEAYLDNPANHTPEYFQSIKDCVLNAHLLTTWAQDNYKELHK
jgi:hypothetical protein